MHRRAVETTRLEAEHIADLVTNACQDVGLVVREHPFWPASDIEHRRRNTAFGVPATGCPHFRLGQLHPLLPSEQVGRDVAEPARSLEGEAAADFQGDHPAIEIVRFGLSRRGRKVGQARHDAEAARYSRHAVAPVGWMGLEAVCRDAGEDVVFGPVEYRPPAPYAPVAVRIGDRRPRAATAFRAAHTGDADDGMTAEPAFQFRRDDLGLELGGAEPERWRAPARNQSYGAEVLIPGHRGLPAAFPPFH